MKNLLVAVAILVAICSVECAYNTSEDWLGECEYVYDDWGRESFTCYDLYSPIGYALPYLGHWSEYLEYFYDRNRYYDRGRDHREYYYGGRDNSLQHNPRPPRDARSDRQRGRDRRNRGDPRR